MKGAAVLRRLIDARSVVLLSARVLAGRRFWVAALLPLAWTAFQAGRLLIGWRETDFDLVDVQNVLLGVPLAALAIGLGVRVIAGEIDRRTLEIAYTVPGGAHRVWAGTLAAGALLLAGSLALTAAVTHLLLAPVSAGALYGAFQSAAFYLAAAAWFAALGRSEVTGAMMSVGLLTLNAFLTGFGDHQSRLSPFFNPLAVDGASPADVLAWTVQNRIGFVLAVAALVGLAIARAERREKLLGG